jgi:hypothetical protein
MAVAFDATLTADVNGSGVLTIQSTTLTVGSGSNRALICLLNTGITAGATVAMHVTWNSTGASPQAMSLIGTATSTDNTNVSRLVGLVNPASGNLTLLATWNGADGADMDAASFTGVDQTGGATSFPHFASNHAATTNPNVTITTAANNMVVAHTANNSVCVNVMDHTQMHLDCTVFGWGSARSSVASGASITMGASLTTAAAWIMTGTDIQAAGAATLPFSQNYWSKPSGVTLPSAFTPVFNPNLFQPTVAPSTTLMPQIWT